MLEGSRWPVMLSSASRVFPEFLVDAEDGLAERGVVHQRRVARRRRDVRLGQHHVHVDSISGRRPIAVHEPQAFRPASSAEVRVHRGPKPYSRAEGHGTGPSRARGWRAGPRCVATRCAPAGCRCSIRRSRRSASPAGSTPGRGVVDERSIGGRRRAQRRRSRAHVAVAVAWREQGRFIVAATSAASCGARPRVAIAGVTSPAR